MSAPSYTIQGVAYNNVGSAFGAVDSALTANATSISNLQAQVNSGSIGLVQQNSTTRTVTGVAAGAVTAASTDAVNGQLYATKLPKMILERQFAGPLQDTVIQPLRDPVDGTICYLYLPISAPHSPTTATGFVQYGPNIIGNINCQPVAAAPAGRKP